MNNQELALIKGKRRYLFCTDLRGAESINDMIQQAIAEKVPFDHHIIEQEPDNFIDIWFQQQKMGTYLYIVGQNEFVKRVEKLAIDAGFSQYDRQTKVVGHRSKSVICSKCHANNEVDEDSHITCKHCGLELEVSDHYSRRLDAYLGYHSIK
ncbi:dimethylamine monooxygenase subunit DmmA family protein [Pseudoneobacillus sp. C159]